MNEKKLRLTQTALTLFYQRGVNSVGINEILAVSGIAKKTLYHHFSSKDELVLAALQYRHEVFYLWLKKTMDKASPIESIMALFHGLTRWFANDEAELGEFRGCFFINTAAEFSAENSAIRDFCHYHKQKVRALITAKVALLPASKAQVSALSETVFLLHEGAIVSALVEHNLNAANHCITMVNSFISQLDP